MWILKVDQTGVVTWQKTYGMGYIDETAWSIQQTNDGGYIVAARSGARIWNLKLDDNGNVSWQKESPSSAIFTPSIQQTNDGGYIEAGWGNSILNGSYDILILKFDQTGTGTWQKTYGGIKTDFCDYAIKKTTDGGYIVGGRTNSFGVGDLFAMWILKLDGNGNINNADFIDTITATVSNTSVSGVTSHAIITITISYNY